MKLTTVLLYVFILFTVGCAMSVGGAAQTEPLEELEIDEASGLAASLKTPGLLYTHNDSGGRPVVFVLNHKGLVPAKILLEGVTNRDWEDIAVAIDPAYKKSYVFVGDIGDNAGNHRSSYIYRFAEPDIADTLITVSDIDKIEYVYEDGPRDAEALFCDPKTGDIYVISKREENVGVYQISYPQSFSTINTAYKLGSLPYNWVTAADISSNGKYILIKTYTNIYRYKRSLKGSVALALAGKYRTMPYQLEEQGEAVAFDRKGKGYYTLSEKIGANPVDLYYYK